MLRDKVQRAFEEQQQAFVPAREQILPEILRLMHLVRPVSDRQVWSLLGKTHRLADGASQPRTQCEHGMDAGQPRHQRQIPPKVTGLAAFREGDSAFSVRCHHHAAGPDGWHQVTTASAHSAKFLPIEPRWILHLAMPATERIPLQSALRQSPLVSIPRRNSLFVASPLSLVQPHPIK